MTRHGYTRAEEYRELDDGTASSVPPRLTTASELLPEQVNLDGEATSTAPSSSSPEDSAAPERVEAAKRPDVPAAVEYDPAPAGSNVVRHLLFGEPLSRMVRDRKLEQILPLRGSIRQDQPLSTPEVLLLLKTLESKSTTRVFPEVVCASAIRTTLLMAHIDAYPSPH